MAAGALPDQDITVLIHRSPVVEGMLDCGCESICCPKLIPRVSCWTGMLKLPPAEKLRIPGISASLETAYSNWVSRVATADPLFPNKVWISESKSRQYQEYTTSISSVSLLYLLHVPDDRWCKKHSEQMMDVHSLPTPIFPSRSRNKPN